MKEKHDPLNDLKEIRQMMESSSRFISLSGLSGVLAGIYALIGVTLIHFFNFFDSKTILTSAPGAFYENGEQVIYGNMLREVTYYYYNIYSILIALVVLLLAVGTSVYFTYRKMRKDNMKIWTPVSQKLLINLAIPLMAGGWLCLILFLNGSAHLIASMCLLFYGVALMNASKYTLPDIWYLGLLQIGLGMISLLAPGYGLIFWGLGFGVAHIIYGLIMYNKYERK